MSALRRHGARVAAALGVVAALLLSLATISTSSAFSARVTNSTDTAATAPYFTCRAADVAPSSAYFVYPLSETTGTTAADVSAGTNRPGTYTAGGVTYGATGPCERDSPNRGITLNGSTGYVSGPTTTQANPVNFTEEIWFRTTTRTGGKLIGFGNARTGSSGNYDRHLYLSDSGAVYFGVYPNAVRTVNSPAGYNDGTWHHAAASLSSTAGMALYVDGALVATDPATTTAQNYTGYWRIGYDNNSGWGTGTPTSNFFAGSLAFAAVYTSVLTADQVQSHYIAGS
ncbi:hypothetical protein GCM10027047_34390 [Rhodococcus aerolatus]